MEEKQVILALGALAQSHRLRIFRLLVTAGQTGLTPGAITEALEMPAATLSFHLKELSHSGLISQERQGRYLIYRAALDQMTALLTYLTENCCQGEACEANSVSCGCWKELPMKRFHVHLHVADLAQSIAFYSKLFAAEPMRREGDYAKWMLNEPAVNFAISTRGNQPGIDHLGIQTDDPSELAAMKARAEAADMALLDQGATSCCYARSEKHWITDPQGIAWEHFHTLDNIPVFSETAATNAATNAVTNPAASASACCPPTPRGKPVGIPVKSGSSCC